MNKDRQPFQLTAEQYHLLTQGITEGRIGKNPKGFSHIEAWDARRWLIRIFGFGGFDIETKNLGLVAQVERRPGRWTVVYRAEVRLTVRDQFGGWAVVEDGACGDSVNQPSLGDAHDNASKTALSQALKRCLVNWGDQFGLSLYNGGIAKPVVLRSLVCPDPPAGAGGVEPPVLADDGPVLPEPGTEPAEVVEEVVKPVPAPDPIVVRDWALAKDRTEAELRAELTRLRHEHPQVLTVVVVNDTGDDQQVGELLQRRIHDLADASAAVARADKPPMVTQHQHNTMHALWTDLGYHGPENRDNRLIVTSNIVKRKLDTSAELTEAEADRVIGVLKQRMRQHGPRPRPRQQQEQQQGGELVST